jgi:CRP/FNR family transcriptional regulator
MVSTSVNLLKSVACFTTLDTEVLEWLLDSARERSFARGEVMLQEGDPCTGLFVVQSGSVKLYRTSSAGDEQIMRVVGAGGCFECAPLFDKGPNPVSAQALETCNTVFIPATSFEAMISNYPEVALQIVPILAMRLRDFLNTIEDFSFKPVSTRIAKLLLQLGGRQDKNQQVSLPVSLTQHHLACIVGCSRQVLNGYLQELVREGIIKIENRRVIVLNPEILRELTSPKAGD